MSQLDHRTGRLYRRLRLATGGAVVAFALIVGAALSACDGDASPGQSAASLTATFPPTPSPLPEPPTATPTPTTTPTLEPYAHTVQSGETGLGILTLYGYTDLGVVPEVLALNNLGSFDNLFVGQVLLIPRQTPTPGPTATLPLPDATISSSPDAGAPNLPPPTDDPNRDYTGCSPEARCASADGAYWMHEVRAGDTIIGIAYQYDSSMNCMLRENSLTQDMPIHEGQILRVCILATLTPTLTPTGGPDSTVTPTPTLSPPLLLAPGNGETVSRGQTAVLQWAAVRALAVTQSYLVIVTNVGTGEETRYIVQDNILRLPDALRPGLGQSATYQWQVVIVSGAGTESPIISGVGPVWQFVWQ